jgi:hypothetical protein
MARFDIASRIASLVAACAIFSLTFAPIAQQAALVMA